MCSSVSTRTTQKFQNLYGHILQLSYTSIVCETYQFYLDTMQSGHIVISFSLLFMFVAVTRANNYAQDSGTVLRQHYGIVLKPREKFTPVMDSWLHTFSFFLPRYTTVPRARVLNCLHVSHVYHPWL